MVDDLHDEIEDVAFELEQHGLHVTHVEDPYQAIEAMQEMLFDVLVTDNDMKLVLESGEFEGIIFLQFLNGYKEDPATGEIVKEAIQEQLHLLQPIYRHTSVYGHFGRSGFPWEESHEVDKV